MSQWLPMVSSTRLAVGALEGPGTRRRAVRRKARRAVLRHDALVTECPIVRRDAGGAGSSGRAARTVCYGARGGGATVGEASPSPK